MRHSEVRLALFMKPLNFRIVPLSTEVADASRRMAATGAPDHVFVSADSPLAFPCRHCLHWAEPGERIVLFPYTAIPPGYPYSETGPIFVHADACQRYEATNEYPCEFFRDGERSVGGRLSSVPSLPSIGCKCASAQID